MNAVAILRRTLPTAAAARSELREIADRIEAIAPTVDQRRSNAPVVLREARKTKQ